MNIFPKNLLIKYFIIAVLILGPSSAFSQVSISINIAPPPLQVYDQPACPGDGYLWTPGYWAYGDNAYYWVPGAWVQPPDTGVLWTPPYWGWDGNAYVFYPGYWGPNVGYYGGINYGYGYGGSGYGGGRWQGGHFSYNTAVNNVRSAHVHYTYADRSAINNKASKVSYNGGKGGVQAKPTAQQRQLINARHTQPTSAPQPKATLNSQAPTQQKAEPQHKPAQVQQPELQQKQAPPQQKAEPKHEPAQAQQPERRQQDTQAKQETRLQPQAQAQPSTHEQPVKPKTASHPQQQAQQPTADRNPAAQPDKKADNNPNNAPSH